MLRFASALVLLVLLASSLGVQARQTAARHAGSFHDLAQFEGTYEYHGDKPLFIVSDRGRLVAR